MAESKYATNTARLFDTQNRSIAALQGRALVDGGNQPDDGFPGGGDVFPKNSLAEQDGWLMRANKDTQDYPAPRGNGVLNWASGLGDTPAWSETNVSAASLVVGFRFTMPADLGAFSRAFRYWLPASAIGFRVEVWVVGDPTGTPDMTKLLSFVADAADVDQWITISVGQSPIAAGEVFDLALVILPMTGATSFSYEWDYERKNGNPDQGKIWHQSGANQDQMRVHQEDKDSVNRSTDLDNIGPGSTIEITGYTWTVQSASKTGSVYTFIVDPATRAGSDTYTFRFTYYSTLPIPYVYITDQNAGNDLVDGFISTTGYDDAVFNDNAYGVDAQLEGASVSPDWDFRAYSNFSAGGGSGGGGGSGAVDSVAGVNSVLATPTTGNVIVRLQGDGTPVANQYYGTDNFTTLGYHDLPAGGGAVNTVTGADSVSANPTSGNVVVRLQNDGTPAADQYYGTNNAATLGYHDLPAGGGGAVDSVTGQNSVDVTPTTGATVVQLQGDAATPGSSKYYGTDGAGSRGYHDLPSGGGGSVDSVSGTDSVAVSPTTGNPVVNLVNDQATPGNFKYYGTDGAGSRGYHDLPAGGGAVDSVTGANSVSVAPTTGNPVVQLEGDGTPTLNQYYGTDGGGTRGYHDLPTGAVDSITGVDSVSVSPTTGAAVVRLQGDSAAPGNLQYYGTDGSGARGFYPAIGQILPSETINLSNELLEVIFQSSPGNVRISFEGLYAATNNQQALLRVSTDGGNSYTAASVYTWEARAKSSGTPGDFSGIGEAQVSLIVGANGITSNPAKAVFGHLDIYNPARLSSQIFMTWNLVFENNAGALNNYLGSAFFDESLPVDAIQIFPTSGVWAGGTARVYYNYLGT